ncbi:type II toxin-antitoxin system HicB family antitoxin [Bacillus sp. BP-3]|uniref:type II toxin-antitoxin system HicB family antitoxin n=1 Tax=Bacillus sp. BP-3 TaxID=3022773 RepID=UPI00232B8C64|nr:type II toxin-antitoxin system HicB family antitoxin [Bacillus sp. BP-3]MDC2864565.1 type II toxin-antitoxin system HicB family antitoxin [Bacillus sp. BP-3]
MKKRLLCLSRCLEKASDGYGIYFPDLPGCVSHANTQEDALQQGREALGLHLSEMEKKNDPISEPTLINKLELEQDEYSILIDVWMPPLRKKDSTLLKGYLPKGKLIMH